VPGTNAVGAYFSITVQISFALVNCPDTARPKLDAMMPPSLPEVCDSPKM